MTKKDRTQKEKEVIAEHLRSIPIVEVACKKAGISRATYYRWRSEDPEFLRLSEEAMQNGIDMVNDMTESHLIGLIKEKKMPAITLWLRHNHPRFLLQEKAHSLSQPRRDVPLSKEQEEVFRNALALFA